MAVFRCQVYIDNRRKESEVGIALQMNHFWKVMLIVNFSQIIVKA
jgi:hypothetical protein